MYHSAYLKLDDDSRTGANGDAYKGIRVGYCGEDCTHHWLLLKSSVDQEVHLTAHTWDQRMYPKDEDCVQP